MNTELDAAQDRNEIVQAIQKDGDFSILPYPGSEDFNDKSRFDKLSLTPAQRVQIGGLISNLPAATPGKVLVIPANVKHWHGAKADSWFSHIAVEVPGEKCSTEWCEPVSDEEYGKL
mgnify:CR=1 FL=1